jgi:hypothetical protein
LPKDDGRNAQTVRSELPLWQSIRLANRAPGKARPPPGKPHKVALNARHPMTAIFARQHSVFSPTASEAQIRYLRRMISPWHWLFATLAGVLLAAVVVATASKGRASPQPKPFVPSNLRLHDRESLSDPPVVSRRQPFFTQRQLAVE